MVLMILMDDIFVSLASLLYMYHTVSMTVHVKTKWIISTTHPFHIYWDIILLLCTTYLIIMIPSRIVFFLNHGNPFEYYTMASDYLVDCVFLIDMILQGGFFAYNDLQGGRKVMISDRVSTV